MNLTRNRQERNSGRNGKNAVRTNKVNFYSITYFNHGANIYAMGPWGGKNTKLEGLPNSTVKKGNAKLLDGEYKWYNGKGGLRSVHVLKNGWYVSFKEYYPDGTLQTDFDYTKH